MAAADVQERMSALPEVERVRDRSGPRTAALVPVDMAESSADDVVTALQDVTAGVAASPGLEVSQAGGESIDAAIWERVGDDLAAAERLSLPITFAVLLLAFGALLAAGIPLLLAVRRRRDDGHLRAAVAPASRRRHGGQRGAADRARGRRRLLAVLPQARA